AGTQGRGHALAVAQNGRSAGRALRARGLPDRGSAQCPSPAPAGDCDGGVTMAEQRKSPASPVPTPLHLLQGLTRTLYEHLAEACQQAEEDAQKVLDKLAQKRARLLEKAAQAEARLAEARTSDACEDKLEKLDSKLSELRERLAVVAQAHDNEIGRAHV